MMRTPEQIAEEMWLALNVENERQGPDTRGLYRIMFDIIAANIARECARAKLEAVEPNPAPEGGTITVSDDAHRPQRGPSGRLHWPPGHPDHVCPACPGGLRSDGARHSDCTNCGGQSATGGVFPPCEACGSTGDRVAQLERGIVSAACAWADEPASDAVDCCTAKERAAGNALFDAVTEWRAKVKALTGLATRLDRVAGAVKAAQAQSFMMGDSPDAATDPGFCFNCGGTRAQCKCESPAFGLMTAAETQRLARHVEDRKAAMGPALDVRPRMNEACSECGAAIEDMGRPEYCEASGSIDPHADKVLHNWVARCLVRKAGHR